MKKEKTIEYGPIADAKHSHGFKHVRWVENVSRGLRRVDFADKIIRLNHKGWYTHDDGDPDETYRGVVYQLPSRGVEQYVYGYDDPNNDDCALLCFDVEIDKERAARFANDLAEAFAEHERDYHRAWDAGRRYDDLAEEIKAMRTEALTIGRELRAARKLAPSAPQSCKVLRERILTLYRHIQVVRDEREKLRDSYGRADGFADGATE